MSRTGFHTVTPRMLVDDPRAAVAFLREVFGAEGVYHEDRPAELRIGDSIVMVSAAQARERFPAFLYVYTEDADVTYARAIAAGAEAVEPPSDLAYGDRRATVRDRFGNLYQIAHVLDGDR